MEEWRSVPGYPSYEVSNLGRVRRINHKLLKPWYGGRRIDYPNVVLYTNGERHRVFVHVLVARAFIGVCPPGYEHNHKDGDKCNPAPENLEFVTRSENQHHRFATLRQTQNQGMAHGMSKLTDTNVVAIRALHANGLTMRAIAAQFGVGVPTVSMIVNKKTWRHLLHERDK